MLEPENARDRVIVQRIRNGDTYEAIGNDYGITRQRVQQIAEKYGVRPLGVDEKPLSGPDLLVADLLQSEPRLSYRDVSEHTGLSQRQVRRIAEKAGSAWMRWPVYRRGIHRWDYDEDADAGCWNWRYGKSAQGHGRLNVGQGQSEYAHRFAYEQHHGPITSGAAIIHACGNYSCVNPEHLSMETGWQGDGVMLQQVAYAVADGVSDDGEGEWRDPYDGEPYSAEERRMIEEARRTVRDGPTHTTEESGELLGLDADDDLKARAGQPAGPAGTPMRRQRVTMALVYDFDGTLAPGNMQERQFIPDVGMTPPEFWSEVDRLSSVNQADRILMYMYFMLRKADERGRSGAGRRLSGTRP